MNTFPVITTQAIDILPSMEAAIIVYKQFGFVETDAYYDTPIVETIFLVRSLKDFETQTSVL
jgi:hypothetical protein